MKYKIEVKIEKVCKEVWKKIIHVHEYTKHITLKAEEFDESFKTFIQPFNELRNTLEHIIRANSVIIGINDCEDSKYIDKNLDKALGHEYRAFFDSVDWLSMSLRDRIIETLKPFHHEAISKAIPDYYSNIRPRIDEIGNEIARLREEKDIANGSELMIEVEHYKEILDELFDIDKKIRNSVSAVIEIDKAKKFEPVANIIVSFVAGLLVALIVYFFKLKSVIVQ
ncbi:hypothetical protein HY792_04320 [Candidatus Desantisbacteria bacterium]|nr:hypothetical protein [Candidatus Desantisbacteria bacterium]